MSANRIYIGLFILLAIAQLYATGGMIIQHDRVLREGEVHKFLIEPIDPSDPFRGQYLILGFVNDQVLMSDSVMFEEMDDAYGILGEDENGFSYISDLQMDEPDSEYLKLTIDYLSSGNDSQTRVFVKFPFDRYYISEKKALPAEKILQEALRDGNDQKPFALVRILNGEAVLEDIVLNGRPISEILEDMDQEP
ncbi:GDYXXLXY domain-containing protein [Fulvivirga sedimenti]|uniref:GDYXXLXY domain-containing protein n=1 Tax=Fulvivirga sedimenti TaxID=2879465 RepID=A0A9X1HYR9_9BACT|nr:GDYXXLXY domain-containing protein [Fulvivirga sedimenti]MCA6079072.1 GDYXXLXY domain-containing protein [Fulvivirga sedimenti]